MQSRMDLTMDIPKPPETHVTGCAPEHDEYDPASGAEETSSSIFPV
jgi:hypothetical protein